MAARSMARIFALCLALCALSRPARAEHAPPPAIVLAPPPAPELPTLEYQRRPFEIAPELTLGLPSCADGSASSERCSGMGAGLGFGLSALWRPSPYFAFGPTLSLVGFRFHPDDSTGLRDGGAHGLFYGLLGRVHFFDRGWIDPYLELGIGSGKLDTSAQEAGVEYDESASGLAVRAGGAIEFHVGRHLRLGPAFAWTRFNVSTLQRCGGARCVDLDAAGYGHNVGFSSISLRVSILLGPAQ